MQFVDDVAWLHLDADNEFRLFAAQVKLPGRFIDGVFQPYEPVNDAGDYRVHLHKLREYDRNLPYKSQRHAWARRAAHQEAERAIEAGISAVWENRAYGNTGNMVIIAPFVRQTLFRYGTGVLLAKGHSDKPVFLDEDGSELTGHPRWRFSDVG